MFRIRPFDWSDEDYGIITEISNANYPDELETVELMKHRDRARDQNYMLDRIVAEVDGKPVGSSSFGESMWTPIPGKYWLFVQVHPDLQRRGHGSRIYDHVTGILNERQPTIFDSWTREDKADAVAFLETRGYKQVMRGQNSRLDLREFDPSKFEDVVERVGDMGIRIVTAGDLAETDAAWMEKLWELDWVLSLDVPEVDEQKKRTFEVYRRQTFESPTFIPETFFVALDDGEYVGMSQLEKNLADETKLQTDLTGVVRTHRRRGIATALKVRALTAAKAAGKRWVDTDNEEKNPMYLLNVQLGFKPTPGWLHMRKNLKDAGGTAAAEE